MNIVDRASLPGRGKLILINGPSSAGKTTLAGNIQRSLSYPVLHVQLDAFRAMEPPGYFDRLPPEVRWRRVAALCRAMNAACVQHVLHGQDVLLDHALPAEGWQYLREDLGSSPVVVIGVFCALEELERRERQRADRPRGLAASQYVSVHEGRHYNMEIDTSSASALECAAAVTAWLETNPSSSLLAHGS